VPVNHRMRENHQEIFEKVKVIADIEFNKLIEADILRFQKFLHEFETCIKSFNTKMNSLKGEKNAIQITIETLNFKQNIHDKLSLFKEQFEVGGFKDKFEPLFKALEEYLNTLDEVRVREQQPESFSISEEDKFPLKALKAAKIINYKITSAPVKVLNVFRAEKQPQQYWSHKIPMRSLSHAHLKGDLVLNLHQVYKEFFEVISNTVFQLEQLSEMADQKFLHRPISTPKENVEKIVDASIAPPTTITTATSPIAEKEEQQDTIVEETAEVKIEICPIVLEYQPVIDAVEQELSLYRTELQERTDAIFQICFERFALNYEKVGTVELAISNYGQEALKQRQAKLDNEYQKRQKEWSNSVISKLDTYLYRLEIKILRYLSTKEFFRIERTYLSRINENIIGEYEELNDFINKTRENIQGFSGKPEDFKKLLLSEKISVHKTLTTDLIPKTVNFIVNQDLPKLVHQADLVITKRVGQLGESRMHVKEQDSVFPITADKIDKINPKRIVSFETLPRLSKKTKQIRNELFVELDKIQHFLKEMNEMVIFTLESAIAVFQKPTNEKEQAEKGVEELAAEAKEIAKEGLDRALNRMQDIYSELDAITKPISESLHSAVLEFNNSLEELQEPDKLNTLRNRLASSVAMQSTQEAKTKVIEYFKTVIPMIGFVAMAKYKQLKKGYLDFAVRWGIHPVPDLIATEIADYYAESQAAAAKLPFVYQRLFNLEPNTTDFLTELRIKELEKMNKAFKNWDKGFYAPTIVVAERGGGVSSLIQTFLKNEKLRVRVIKAVMDDVILGEKAFLDFLRESFEKPELEKVEDLIEYLNNLDYKQIIVLEDVQQLFLKMVNGFGALKMLFELVSKTNSNVFWLTSCTLYAYEYLQKTLDISDYFAYIVRIDNINDQTMIDEIMRRHRISGYDINFVPTTRITESKKFKKLDPAKVQEFLKTEYFVRLNNYAQSNFSLGIIYWLRSTEKVEGNVINIGIQDIDYSFLNSLSNEKVIVLHELILHDGLTYEQLSIIKDWTIDRTQLLLLLLQDDGIIFNNKDLFEINLLLYRPIVRLLKSKNMIH